MSDVEQITPALSVERWTTIEDPAYDMRIVQDDEGDDVQVGLSRIGEKGRHAMAAMCLYGQPYGFTHGEIQHLSHAIDDAERWIAKNPYAGHDGAVEASRVVLAKLRALLPPLSSLTETTPHE